MKDLEKRKEIIKKVIDGKLTRKEAEYELSLSRQQVYRLIKAYKDKGDNAFIQRKRNKKSSRRTGEVILEQIEKLYYTEYFDYNLTAFYEVLQTKYEGKYDVIPYSTLHKKFLRDDLISTLAHKGTIKLYAESMEKTIKGNNSEDTDPAKIEFFKTREIAIEKAHVRKSSNLFGFGQEIQMDACEKYWFGDIVTYLHLAVDKGTKKVLFGWFEYEEVTRGYFVLLYNILVNYGIPLRIKTDNRNSFSNQKNKVDTTQFGTICNQLGIELVTTSIPTKKANVERENKTFKDRLIAEFRHEGIVDIDMANKYLNEIFIPRMNKLFSYEIDNKTSKIKKNHYTEAELNLIISEKSTRIIDNASSIKYGNDYYVPTKLDTGEYVCFTKGTECIVILSYNAELWCKVENNYYTLTKIEKRDTTMKKEINNKKPTDRKKYIPPKDHPWRKNMMLKKRVNNNNQNRK